MSERVRIGGYGSWAIGACVVVAGLGLPAMAVGQSTATFERTLQVTGPVDLEVSTGAGQIEIRTGDAGVVEVRGRIRGRSGRRNNSDRVAENVQYLAANPPIEQVGNVIRIGRLEARERRQGISISYELVVLVATRAESHTGTGSQTIDGLAGPIDVGSGSGSLEISNIADDVDASAGSGMITVDSVQGDVDLRTGSGAIRAHRIDGVLEARTGSGNITADGTPDRR